MEGSRQPKGVKKSKKKQFAKDKSNADEEGDAPQLSRKEKAELRKAKKAERSASFDQAEEKSATTTVENSGDANSDKKLTKKQLKRQAMHEKEAVEAAAKAAAAAAEPIQTEGEVEDQGPQLHLMTGKQRKKHVKKLQSQRKQEKLPDLTEDEIEQIFAFVPPEDPAE